MCVDYLAKIRKIQPAGPYCLLGWSFGGLLAYSIACHLQSQGDQVAFLSLLDSYPIDQKSRCHPPDEQQILRTYIQTLGCDQASLGEEHLHLANVKELLQREGHFLSNLEDEHFTSFVQIYKNNHRLARTFIPQQLNANVLLFTATQRETAPPTERWRPHVRGPIKIHPIACHHDHMTLPGSIAEVGRILAIELGKQRTKRPEETV
jgi:nonribosomal peptide synthetase DhbF